ncbi:MAG: hypothetical protein ACOYXR_08940 [Nitrospirota bacterium]
MAKLSDEAKKKIAEAVKRSWVLRRARMAGKAKGTGHAAPGGTGAAKSAGKGRRKLSAAAKQRIAEAVKRSWALRRAGRTGATVSGGRGSAGGARILASIQQASRALRSLTLDDLRPLAGRKDAAAQLAELAGLASDLRRLIAP